MYSYQIMRSSAGCGNDRVVSMDGFLARGGAWVAAQIVLFAAFLWALRLTIELPAVVAVLGWLMTAAGVGLTVGGLATLGPNLTPYPEPLTAGSLVERGVYRLVRHPIYGGLCIAAIGLALGRGSPAALAIGIVLLLFFGFKAEGEERRLAAAYPGYTEYQARVRARLVPWLY